MTRKTYTREFKIEAVRLLKQGDKPGADIARDLGVKRNQLYKWLEEVDLYGEANAFPGHGNRSRKAKDEQAEENERLKKEIEELKEEVEILKKAAAYFAKDLG